MATPGRLAALPLSQRLRRTPQRFELLQALLLLERERPQALPLGTGNAPRAEALRLRGPLDTGVLARTLDEIGQVYGVTRERIRQIESKTMAKLRHPSRSQSLRDYLE